MHFDGGVGPWGKGLRGRWCQKKFLFFIVNSKQPLAKRILNRVEKFKTVILDFEGVDFIGQAFADEVFRIFAKRNPQIELIPMNEMEISLIDRSRN